MRTGKFPSLALFYCRFYIAVTIANSGGYFVGIGSIKRGCEKMSNHFFTAPNKLAGINYQQVWIPKYN